MGVVVNVETYGAHNRKRKRGSRTRWASWRGKFSMRCRNPGNIVRGARRVAVGSQTGQYDDAEQQVKKTSQCGAVSIEILPVCSMERVNCTPVKQTDRCRSRVLSAVWILVIIIIIGNEVQTTSDTSCE